MRNIALLLGYDGTCYCGWQRQKNGNTVQAELENAVGKIVKEDTFVQGCSRTDAGVHAKRYLASFRTDCSIPESRIPAALNSLLPKDIAVYDAWECSPDFNARFSVKEKTYVYKIYTSKVPDPFLKNYAYYCKYPLNTAAMKQAGEAFLGAHDFLGFMASGGTVRTTVRTIYDLRVDQVGNLVEISVTGDGFLYNMVRIIAGTLFYVGAERIPPEDVKGIIASRDRNRAGVTMPPQGLYLQNVVF